MIACKKILLVCDCQYYQTQFLQKQLQLGDLHLPVQNRYTKYERLEND